VGTNPFIVGDEAKEVNIFYDLIKPYEDKVKCFQINTGGIGEIRIKDQSGKNIIKREVERIPIKEMASIIRGIARDSIVWKQEPYFGTLVPEHVDGMEINKYDPKKYYSDKEIEKMVSDLKQERRDFIKKMVGLNPKIVNSLF